jgi:hypothetical protein
MPSSFQSLWNRVFPRTASRKQRRPERVATQHARQRRRLFEPLEDRRVLAVTFVDPNPAPGNHFGEAVVALSTGNVVISAPFDNAGGVQAGAVYLFNGTTGDLISTIRGSSDHDNIGFGGITPLSNGNFVIGSPSWHSGGQLVGAATFGNGITGVSGTISASNSLIGSTAGDSVGSVGTVYPLSNGHYVVRTPSWDNATIADAGAVTWGNGGTGVTGTISAANSLVGAGTGNFVGSHGVKTLSNGNYVVISSHWGGGSGAVTFANGATGLVGTVSATNSLVGSGANEVGSFGVVEVGNSNYVVLSPFWDNGGTQDTGAATWGSGTAGITGTVSASNSLVGSTANDHIGMAITVLTNGNFVLRSTDWDNGVGLNSGAATWGSATAGIVGVVSASNSLVGSRTGDMVANQVVALTNGNYVVNSPTWSTATLAQVGAVTWADGSTGRTGLVDASNSLVGALSQDSVGSGNGVVALTNGNYVVASSAWDNGSLINAGAVTWANGLTGLTGTVTAANSLVGGAANDIVGYGGVTPLTNGNFVVSSPLWKNSSGVAVGAVTWRSGTSGGSGVVSAANSLVGSTLQDFVGDIGSVLALSNGNYVANSPNWDNGAVANVGAVTWGNGSSGTSGVISPSNSLVGSTTNDRIGNNGVTRLVGGNYVVTSTTWDNAGVVDAGAATWGNGATGSVGVLSPTNSLVGSQTGDQVGINGVVALANGNFIVSSANWDNGALQNAGAVSWSSGTSGVVGAIVAPTVNHVKGGTASTSLQAITLDNTNGNFFARFTAEGTGIVRVGSQATGFDVAIPGTLAAAFSLGNLSITDIDGVGKDNILTVTRVNISGTDYYEFTDPVEAFTSAPSTTPASTLSNANHTLRVAASAITGSLTVNLLAGNDTLNINLTGGDVIPTAGLTFNGSAPVGLPGDRLNIVGGSQGAVTYNYTNANDGNIALANFGTVNFTGLDQGLVNSGSTTDTTFNFPATGSAATWADDGTAGNGLSRLSSPGFVRTDFTNPLGGITINRGHSTDSLTVNGLPDVSAAITLGTSVAQLSDITLAGVITLAIDKNFTAFANGTISLPNASSDLTLSGTGAAALTSTRNIAMGSGASITTVSGNISLDANQQAAVASGNFVGVDLANAALSSTSGTVTVRGRGGNFAVGQQHGVRLSGGAIVGAGTTNTVTVDGTGGAASGNDNHGVWVTGTNSGITSGGGNVTVTGSAGGSGSSAFNYGVNLSAGGKIQATGSGNVTVTGTSTVATGNGNIGVNSFGAGTAISSGVGNVQITGTGGGSGSSVDGWGVFIGTGAIATTGGAGTMSITGTGGAGTGGTNHGILITQSGSLVSTASGSVSLNGTAGAGAGTTSFAVNVTSSASVQTTASGPINIVADSLNIDNTSTVTAGAANVTLLQKTNGRLINLGAADSATQLGLTDSELDRFTAGTVLIGNANTGTISTSAAITHANHLSLLTGAGIAFGDALTLAANKNLNASAVSTISLTNAMGNADVATSGTGTIDITTARNVVLNSGSSIVTVDGALTVSANQQNPATTGAFKGIELINGQVRSLGLGNVTVSGRGGFSNGSSNLHGVNLNLANSLISSGGGNVVVNGTGGGIGTSIFNHGVVILGGAQVTAGGTGTVTVNANGGNEAGTGNANFGLNLEDNNSRITSSGGAVLVTGRGGSTLGASSSNQGIVTGIGTTIAAGGAGTTTVNGFGGGLLGGPNNDGMELSGLISSGGGNVSVTGTGGGAAQTDGTQGIFLFADGTITAASNGIVTVVATGGSSPTARNSDGMTVAGTISTNGGNLFLTATGGTSTSQEGQVGLRVINNAVVAAGGTGVTNITAAGGTGSLGFNHGIYMSGSPLARIGSGSGGVNIVTTVADGQSTPLFMAPGGSISTTANGPINVSANGISMDIATSINAGTGSLTIQPSSAGIEINLGAADIFNRISLTDAEMDRMTAGTLILGNATTGTVTLSTSITRPAATITQINSAAAINFTTGSYDSAGGDVTLNPGTVISPATSGVDVTTGAGTLAFGSNDDLTIVINGLTVDTQHQQLNVAGLVNLTGLDLAVSGSFVPTGSESFVIVNNDGTDPVVGTFNGIAEGTLISANFLGSGLPASVSYVGGTGNDVVINVGGAPGTTTVEVNGGNLIITDAMGGDTNDSLTITRSGANIRITDPLNSVQAVAGGTQVNPNTVDVPFASITGNLQLNTLGGNDSVTFSLTGGNVLPAGGVVYGAGTGNDSLILSGGTTTAVAHTVTNASDGSVTLSGALAGTITYTGLEPITDSLLAADRSFILSAGAEDITLTDAVGANQNLFSTLGRSLTFANPTASLTLDAAAGNDTVNITSVDADGPFNASLTINGGTGDDTVNLNADINFTAGRNLDVDLQNDDVAPGVDSINLGSGANLLLSGTGAATLRASRNIALADGSSVVTVNGALTIEANRQAVASTGLFSGVTVEGAVVEATGTGDVAVRGTGGNGAGGLQFGVLVAAGGIIRGGTTGTTIVQGTGGASTGTQNLGVRVTDDGSQITSLGANVQVAGIGGGSGTSGANRGVDVVSPGPGFASISAGGAGTVTVTGTGSNTRVSPGVRVSGEGGRITSSGGAVQVIGQGGNGSLTFDLGVWVDGGIITSGTNASVTVQGTAGTSPQGTNYGVYLSSLTAIPGRITSGGGPIQITGQGGNGAGGANIGVFVSDTGEVAATATSATTITGTAGQGTSGGNFGVAITGSLVSAGANVTLIGTGGDGPTSHGIGLDQATLSMAGTSILNMQGIATQPGMLGFAAGFPGNPTTVTHTGIGSIEIVADSVHLETTATITAANGRVAVMPRTAGHAMNLGSTVDTTAGTLELSDAELDRISTATLQLGDAAAGTVVISAGITRNALTALNVVSNGAINFTTGSLSSNGGIITLNPGTNVSPATSGVDVNADTGAVRFGANDDLAITINGLTPDTQLQQLNVVGTVNLTGLDLVVSGTHAPLAGETFLVVNNDSTDPIVGTFNGFAEGATITGNFLGSGLAATVSYVGGTGNDVVLTVIAPPDTTSVEVTGGNLIITDIAGGDTSDTLTVTRVGAVIRITDPNNRIAALAGATQVDPFTVTVPFASVTGNLQVNTLGGDDRLTVDFAIGNPLPAAGLVYSAGAGTADALVLTGALTTTVSHTIANATDGSVVLTGSVAGTITYTGVEPITDSLLTTGRDFNYPATSDTIELTDAAGPNQTLTGPSGRTITFLNPNVSLTLNAGGGNDVVTLTSIDANGPFNAALTINGGTGDDTVNLNSDITFAANRDLDLDLQNDAPAPGADTINFGATANLVLAGAGAATLRASRNIAMASGSSLVTVNGNLVLEANQQLTPTSGDFQGIALDSAVLSATGTGAITLIGRGGDAAAGSQHGISIANSSDVAGGGTGVVSVSGRGGAGPGNTNHGVVITGAGSSVTSTGAPLQITGQGDGIGVGTSHPGVVVASEALVSVGGAGALTIIGTGGSTTGGIHHGVHLNGATITSGGGNIQVIGQVGANGASGGVDVLLSSNPATLLSTVGGGGSIGVIGDELAINGTISTSAGNSVTLRPKNNGVAWNLGVNLTDAELDFVTTGTLNIGDTNTGAITISAPITRPAPTALNLTSGGAINFTTGSLNSGGAAILLNPGTSLSPGTSGVDVNAGVGTVAFGSGDDLILNISGTTVDTQYQQLNVVGVVNLTGLDLVITGTMPAFGDSFVIVNNDGTDAVIGTFNGLAEGAGVLVNGEMKKLTYVGGSGNDVALLVGTTTPPTIAAITNRTIDEDAGLQTVSLTGISAGAGETQAISITATSSAPLIIPNPTVTYTSANATGSLALTPVANANGAATITVTVRDAGLDAILNTADDGITSTNFTVTVTAINDAPSFVIGTNPFVGLNSGAQTFDPWATAVAACPANESSQTLTFNIVSNSNLALFAVAPAISPSGVLTFTPATDMTGSADITIFLQDDGGTAGGGVDSTTQQTFTITVGSANTLRVTNFTVTSTGFIAEFNRALNPATLNLYGTQTDNLGPADVVLQRATIGAAPIQGSLIVNPDSTKITFVATSGLLPADNYTVTLRSAADGFLDTNSILLDGDSNGATGDNYVQTFAVDPNPGVVVVSMPNFSRGPQQPVNIPASATTGIPVSFSDGGGILSATFQLRYDPALLDITGATVAPGLGVPSFVSVTPVLPGIVDIQFIAQSALAAGTTRFIDLQAIVPQTALYRTKHVLDIFNIELNDNIPAVDDDAVHVAAYFGDTTANGTYSSQDGSKISRLAVGLDTGFLPYKLLDPVIIGDITGNNSISASDTSRILQAAVGFSVIEIPALPVPAVSLVQGGPDPKLSIPRSLAAQPGDDVRIPVHIDSIVDLTGNGVESADLVIYFDPKVLDVTGASAGSLISRGNWMVSSRIDALAGRIFVSVAGSSPLEGFFEGELVELQATVKANAPAGASAINLAASSRDLNRVTQVNEGYLTLIPAPTDAADDPIDGLLTITSAAGAAAGTHPAAQLVGDRLIVTGTQGDDRLFIAPLGDSQVRVRAGNRILGDFATPAAVAIDALAGKDYVVVDPRLQGAVIAEEAAASGSIPASDIVFAGEAAVLVDSPISSEVSAATSGQTLSNHELALLQLLDQWNSEDVPAGGILRRRR